VDVEVALTRVPWVSAGHSQAALLALTVFKTPSDYAVAQQVENGHRVFQSTHNAVADDRPITCHLFAVTDLPQVALFLDRCIELERFGNEGGIRCAIVSRQAQLELAGGG